MGSERGAGFFVYITLELVGVGVIACIIGLDWSIISISIISINDDGKEVWHQSELLKLYASTVPLLNSVPA